MGPRLLGATPANLKGHFEDEELRQINEFVLHNEITSDARGRYSRLFAARRQNELWGIKDPRLALTWPHVREFLPEDLRIVECTRDYYCCVKSTMRAYRLSRKDAVAMLWPRLLAIKLIRQHEPSIPWMECAFDDAVSRPREVVIRLAQFSGVSERDGVDEAVRFIDPGLRHYHARSHDSPLPPRIDISSRRRRSTCASRSTV
jgi:hypothetical protein